VTVITGIPGRRPSLAGTLYRRLTYGRDVRLRARYIRRQYCVSDCYDGGVPSRTRENTTNYGRRCTVFTRRDVRKSRPSVQLLNRRNNIRGDRSYDRFRNVAFSKCVLDTSFTRVFARWECFFVGRKRTFHAGTTHSACTSRLSFPSAVVDTRVSYNGPSGPPVVNGIRPSAFRPTHLREYARATLG